MAQIGTQVELFNGVLWFAKWNRAKPI